ncbi:MAG: Dabb family protein [Acidobacteriota bacterium]
MKNSTGRRLMFLMIGGTLFLAGWVMGQSRGRLEPTTVHAVAWTAAEDATPGDHANFKRATEQLLTTMPGLQRAWVGKLRRPLVVGDITRTHGLILEFDTVENKVAYSDHPSRVPWAKVWSEVRIPRSTNFDVIGE